MRKQAIAALGDFYGGLSGKTKDDFVKGNSKYISYMNVYIHPSVELDNCDYVEITENESQNNIQYGDILFTGSSETADDCGMSSVVTKEPNEPIYLNSFCFGLRFKELKDKEPSFYKHYFRSYPIRKQISAIAFGVTRFNLSKKEFGKIQIVVPDLVTQKRIASQLDTFTTLIAKLESELTLRQKQYEFYREKLLNFDGDEEVEWKALGDSVNVYTGNQLNKDDMRTTGQYPVMNGGTSYSGYTDDYNEERNTVTVSQGGASAGFVSWLNSDFWLGAHCYAVKPKKGVNLSERFLFHFLKYKEYDLMSKKQGAGIPGLNRCFLLNLSFPDVLPEDQKTIVSQLDTFTTLIDKLEREIALRQKQYEFYREKLLTFE